MRGNRRWRWLLFVGLFFLVEGIGFYLWRTLRPGMAVRTEPLPGTVVQLPRLSPDGKFLAYADKHIHVLHQMDTATGAVRELGPSGDVKWSADGRYLYVAPLYVFPEGKKQPEPVVLYGPDMVPVLPSPAVSDDRWVVGWAADAPWLAMREADKSTTLQPVTGEGTPVPLFSSRVDMEPLLINREAPSLGVRWTEKRRELLQVERPGASEKVVASDFRWAAFAPDGRSWVLETEDGQLVLQRDGEAPRELIPPGRYEWYRGAWSPDGKWVALVVRNIEQKQEEGLLFSADGVPVRLKLGSFQAVADFKLHESIRWMPDSRTFAFVTYTDPLHGHLFANWVHLVDASTGRERVWRLPYRALNDLRDFQFVDDRTLLATLNETLYRYELR